MKTTLIILISIYSISSFSQSDYEWENYENTVLIDASNADSVTSFENNPESIVRFFYASKIRNDNLWEQVLPDRDKRSDRLKRKLEEYNNWRFTKFKLISKTEYEKNKLWIKIFMEIEINGEKDSGTDEVRLEFINGSWIITTVPS